MKNYKRAIITILIVSLLFGVCACSNKKSEDEVSVETPIESTSTPEVVETEEVKQHTTNYSESEVTEKVTIVVDGKEITPTDNNGEAVETIIHDGIVYLPAKTVADGMGKAYYWDGPEYTVYLGNMDGGLEYPTEELSMDDDIGTGWEKTTELTDNLGNTYSNAIRLKYGANYGDDHYYGRLCNMNFSKFKGTIYVKNGTTSNSKTQVVIKADGKTVYTSPEVTKSSAPIDFDINITGCYELQIICPNTADFVCIGDAGFYQ